MKKVIFCKYNQARNSKYQTKTKIYLEDGKKYIEKEALAPEAEEHITNFQEKYLMTRQLYPSMQVLPCKVENGKVYYDYIVGTTMDDVVRGKLENWDEFIATVKGFFQKYYGIDDRCKCVFESTDLYREFFGEIDCSEEECVRPVNLDVIFDNVFLNEKEEAIIFDYEWVYDIAIPKDYVIYRVLSRLYDKYFAEISARIDFEDFVEQFNISKEKQEKYRKMESAFIQYIFKDGEAVVADTKHLLHRKDRNDINWTEQSLKEEKRQHEEVQRLLENTNQQLKNTNQVLEDTQCNYERLIAEYEYVKGLYETASNTYIQTVQQMQLMQMSSSWKVTKPLRFIKGSLRALKHEGILGSCRWMKHKLKDKFRPEEISSDYGHLTAPVVLKRQRRTGFKKEYKISVITPLFNTPEKFLRDMIESVRNQTYTNWELCVVDFSSAENQQVERICREYANRDRRIRYKRNPDNKGISENTNECLELATGDYIAMLDHDDILHPAAFYEVMKAINEEGSDFVYTDEIKFEGDLNRVYAPNFKSDFGSTELRAHNYICHLNVYKRTLLDKVGLYRKECDGSQDHDMVLRLTEVAEHITHIPKILYYWRVHPNSVAVAIEAKPYATWAGIHAIDMQWERLGHDYYVESVRNNIPCYRSKARKTLSQEIRVVIWGSGSREEIDKTLESIKDNCRQKFMVSIVTADSKTAGLLDVPADQCIWDAVYVQDGKELGMEQVSKILGNHREKYVLFVKAGIKLESKDAIDEMLLHAVCENVAAVDAKILYRDGRTFSAGVVASKELVPNVQFRCKGKPEEYEGFEAVMIHARNVSAVSGICTMISKEDWLKIPQGVTKKANPFIAQSLHAQSVGKELVWSPYAVAQADMREYEHYFNQQQYAAEDVPQTDPFYNSNIRKFGLE